MWPCDKNRSIPWYESKNYGHLTWQNPVSIPLHKSKKFGSSDKIPQASPDTNSKGVAMWQKSKNPLTRIQKLWSPDLTKPRPVSIPCHKSKKIWKYDHLTKIPKHRLNRIQKNDLQLSKTQKHPRDKWKIFDCPTACFKERSAGHVKYARYFYKYLTTYIA